MNFFERQRQVKRMSGRLVILFVLAVVGIIVTIDLMVLVGFGRGRPLSEMVGPLIAVSLLVGVIIGLSSLFRTLSLRSGGGGKVAQALGGVPVPPDTQDPHLRRLRNVVEEVAIAAGVPVPQVYVLAGEPGINAFAAGWSPADAAVAVTRGALERLNRDELQGVIAHEFSHVVNGDMRLNIRLIGVLFGILVLYIVGRVLMAIRGGRKNPLPLIGLAVVVAGLVGILVGRIIKAAVSRQREYLADASAVQYTRQTSGLTGALKKIAGLPTGSNLHHAKAEDVSHMLFGTGKGFSGLFATHPPLLKRIQVLEPHATAQELDALRQRWATAPPSGLQDDAALGLAPAGAPLPSAQAIVPAAPDAITAQVGTVTDSAHLRAGAILGQIPEPVLARVRNPQTVVPLVFGLLFSDHPQVRANQHAALTAQHGKQVADAAWHEGNTLAGLNPVLRLPLAELAFPALRERPPPEQDAVMASVQALIQADGRLSVAEYCLSRLLHEELYEATNRNPSWGTRRFSLSAGRPSAATLLAVLAAAGNPHPQAAEQAFHAGVAQLFGHQPLPYTPPAQGVTALDACWPALDGLGPDDKQRLVQAMVTVIGHDGQTTVSELELLRTICAMLHCPMPPLAELSQTTAGSAGPPVQPRRATAQVPPPGPTSP